MKKLLILSDMHVGRDCKEITGFNQPRPDPEFDQAFIDLLDYYTADKEEEFKLILGGDFIDFMEVVVVPEQRGLFRLRYSFDVTDEEKEFGLGSEPERVLVKLERTIAYHTPFFRRLAKYVRAGGDLVIVRGNHDVELFWPKVQRALRQELAKLAFAGEKLDVDEAIDQRNEFQERVEFLPWFYYEKDRIWFEHGHQYDPYCSFDHWLHPISPTNPSRIDTPVSLFAMRYFVNLLSDFSAHDADVWGLKDYLRWFRAKGAGGMFYTAVMANKAVFRLLQYTLQMTFGRVRAFAKEHNKKLKEVAERFDVRRARLRVIDHLHAVPVSRNLPELMRLLFLDRILLVLGALFLALFVLIVVVTPWVELLGVVLVGVLAWRINSVMEPRRYLLPGPKQAQIAKRISEIMKVPSVVMGHSHVKRVAKLGPGRRYFNTGCWLPPRAGRKHVDPEAPCTCNMSHVLVDEQAELRVFCSVSKTVRHIDVDAMVNAAADGTADVPGRPQSVI